MRFWILEDKKLKGHRIVSVVACLGAMLMVGIVYLWSLFQQPVMDYYSWDVTSVTMVSSVLLFFYPVGAIIGGRIQDSFGPHVSATLGSVLFMMGMIVTSFVPHKSPEMIYLTYSIITGIGSGFVYNAALVCIQKWFPDRKGFGAGLAIAAFGASTAVFTPFLSGLLKSPAFGANAVPMTFRVMGFLFGGASILFGIFMRNPSTVVSIQSNGGSGQRQYKLREVIKYREFWICSSIMLFGLASFMMINPIIKTLAIARGSSVVQAELAVSLTGISSIFSRILFPALSDRFGKKNILLALMGINILSTAGLIFAEGMFYVFLIQMAITAYGGVVGIVSSMVTGSFGTRYAGINTGVVYLSSGISALIFPRVASMISVATGTYTLAFIIGIIACIPSMYMISGYDKYMKLRLEKEKGLPDITCMAASITK